ncbi:MAG: hypothetical protein BWX83_01094 [Candidatus Cloacimonetes bacterium ADurb.Bin117]|nr:MAG: hypothetical protein BWX83_01094 [Candidatus Cloacimonetes bacterium ADurb.Bin117]
MQHGLDCHKALVLQNGLDYHLMSTEVIIDQGGSHAYLFSLLRNRRQHIDGDGERSRHEVFEGHRQRMFDTPIHEEVALHLVGRKEQRQRRRGPQRACEGPFVNEDGLAQIEVVGHSHKGQEQFLDFHRPYPLGEEVHDLLLVVQALDQVQREFQGLKWHPAGIEE